MNNFYSSKTVIVTGGSRGIGAATIKEFAKNDYNVVINYVKSEKNALNLEREMCSTVMMKCHHDMVDPRTTDDVKRLVVDKNGKRKKGQEIVMM